uniref:RING-type domain-containing protein n=1 Tax=Chenopodium quinoa TaxID=63459 RepID=A0A803LHG3_CHEQI
MAGIEDTDATEASKFEEKLKELENFPGLPRGPANRVQPRGVAGSSLTVPGNPRQHRNLGESQLRPTNRDVESVVINIEKLLEISKNCGDCVICLDSFGVEKEDECGGVKVLEKCGHKFHGFCIDEWLRKYGTTCPICRTYVCSSVSLTLRHEV